MTAESRLRVASTWFGVYAAMCEITDEDLPGVTAALDSSPQKSLLGACCSNRMIRLAGWLLLDDPDPLVALLIDAADQARLESPDAENVEAVGRLTVELAIGAASLPSDVSLLAAQVAVLGAGPQIRAPAQAAVAVAERALESAGSEQLAAAHVLLSRALVLLHAESSDLADLDRAIASAQVAVSRTAQADTLHSERANHFAVQLVKRFRIGGDPEDLESAISAARAAVSSCQPESEEHSGYLGNLSNLFNERYERTGDQQDLRRSISLVEAAIQAETIGRDMLSLLREMLSLRLWHRWALWGDSADLKESIAVARDALDATSPTHSSYANRAGNLACLLGERFEVSGDKDDLDNSISLAAAAVNSSSEDPEGHATWLNNLSCGLSARFRLTADEQDLDAAIATSVRAYDGTPSQHVDRPLRLANLANRSTERFTLRGDPADLRAAIAFGQMALQEAPQRSPQRYSRLLEQAGRLWMDDRNADALAEVDRWIAGVRAGDGSFIGVFENAVWLVSELSARQDARRTVDVGLAVLDRAETHAAPDSVLDDIRVRLDGLAAEVAFAQLELDQPQEAASTLERVSMSLVRVHASRIDWRAANAVSPKLSQAAQSTWARFQKFQQLADPSDQQAKEARSAEAKLAEIMAELRRSLGLPEPQAAKTELCSEAATYTWLFAADRGGASIHFAEDTWTATMLPDLTTERTRRWQHHLHPLDGTDNTARDFSIRGPEGGAIPDRAAVVKVCDGLQATVLDLLPYVSSPTGDQKVHWHIPFGIARMLPWQARNPGLRLHLSASLAVDAPTSQSNDSPLVVLADPTGDLPGARLEGNELALLGAHSVVGADATTGFLFDLADEPATHRLHIAAHGDSTPRIHLSDGPLDAAAMSRIGQLLAHCEHLTLNACTSGANADGHSDDNLSLASIAHAWGALRTTVALWPLHDEQARAWALHHYGKQPLSTQTATTLAYQTYG